MTLCEYVFDRAEEEAKKRCLEQFDALVCQIADELIQTAEEIIPDE